MGWQSCWDGVRGAGSDMMGFESAKGWCGKGTSGELKSSVRDKRWGMGWSLD